MHTDEIEFAKELVASKTKDSGYGLMLPLHLSVLKQAISELEAYQNGSTTEFILRQELRVLQRMNDSKTEEVKHVRKCLANCQNDLKNMMELWREK